MSKRTIKSKRQKRSTIPRETLKENEVCAIIGISRDTARRMREKGVLPFCQSGRNIFYLRRHIDEYYANTERNVSSKVSSDNNAIQGAA